MPSISVRLRAYTLPLVLAVLASFAVALHVAPAARANASQISIMMDDDQVVYAPDTQRIAVLEPMKSLGVDLVRATVLWSVVAQGTPNPRTHRRFDPTNPRDYPRGNWLRYDQLINDASAVGIGVYFNVTGPGPSWAMGRTS
jgi:hypothetical protein